VIYLETHDTDLGPCCICRQAGPVVRNIILLERRGPTPGQGWGCFQCGLPLDGATAVLCDDCLTAYQAGQAQLVEVCTGRPAEDGRTPIEALSSEVFTHDPAGHPELSETGRLAPFGPIEDWVITGEKCEACGASSAILFHPLSGCRWCTACGNIDLPLDVDDEDEGEAVDDWAEQPWL
jgi:hypothetical protein